MKKDPDPHTPHDTSLPGGDVPREPGDTPTRDLAPAGLDFLKFFAFAGFAGLFLVAYSYVNRLYDRFGLALNEVEIGYLDTFEYAAYLLGDIGLAVAAIGAAVLAAGVVASTRYVFDDLGFYLSVVVIFLILACTAVLGGISKADGYANQVILGDRGRMAYCEIAKGSGIAPRTEANFQKVTNENRVRMIHQTKDMVYLFVVPQSREPANQSASDKQEKYGEHVAFRRDDLSHCRVFSAVGTPPS